MPRYLDVPHNLPLCTSYKTVASLGEECKQQNKQMSGHFGTGQGNIRSDHKKSQLLQFLVVMSTVHSIVNTWSHSLITLSISQYTDPKHQYFSEEAIDLIPLFKHRQQIAYYIISDLQVAIIITSLTINIIMKRILPRKSQTLPVQNTTITHCHIIEQNIRLSLLRQHQSA